MKKKLTNLVLWLNNALRVRKNFRPEEVMLVFSHCLQNSECNQKIVASLSNCKRCGECPVSGIIELSQRYGVQCAAASGGEMALEKVSPKGVKAVLAIACEKELAAGVKAIYPKPVVAVRNTRPKGPCKDCQVDLSAVEDGLKKVITPEKKTGKGKS
ncbi:MAG: DUF116 domain-containing protein [Candidatus Brocadiia bacterium]